MRTGQWPVVGLGVLLALTGCGDPRRDPAEAGEAYAESLKGKGAARKCVLRSFDAYADPDSRWVFGRACQDALGSHHPHDPLAAHTPSPGGT